ncbi:caspase family protein [Nonomuraea angiospora]|uniref:caspase, EACC1-associated type n=1 Tax=Nonomuraea angiospora TaxID=46172 RepID=UPI00344EE502
MTDDESATVERPRPRWNGPPLLLSSGGARVLVAGTGTHRPDSPLPAVPAVPATVADVGRCLVERAGLAPAHLTVRLDPATPADLGQALDRLAQEATSVLMFYYVGHGLIGPDNELYLATRATVDLGRGAPGYQALPYGVVRQILSASRAELVVVVLDCCFAGRAHGASSQAVERVFDSMWQGAYLITSSSRDENSWALPGVRHTAFSGALLRLLNAGDPAGPSAFTLDHVYHSLARRLPDAGFPRPRRQATDLGDRRAFAVNPAYVAPRSRPVPPVAEAGDEASPYRGLAVYGPEDAEVFFGRQELTRSLVARVREAFGSGRPLIVTGPSGAGKSSVLRAGLIPALRHQLAEELSCVVLAPGADPSAELARRPAPDGRRSLLVVDQFEEVFTACADERARRRFVAELVALSGSAAVVVSVRADFFGHCASYPGLLEAMQRPAIVGPMTVTQLRAAIEGPATRAGLSLEPGLTDLLLEDVGAGDVDHSGGVLPLLSHALLATWQRRTDRTLTMAAYRASGGIARALATSAEETLRRLGADVEPVARDLMVRLVHLDEQTDDTRKRVALADLAPAGVPRRVLDEFVRTRLLTVNEDEAEIAHEALIRAWPRLRNWIEGNRVDLLVRQRLAEDAETWQRQGRDPAYLYADSRLAAAQAAQASQASQPAGGLTATEREFLDAALRRRRRRTWVVRQVIAALTVLLLAAVTAGVLALRQTGEVTRQRDQAVSTRIADSANGAADASLGAQLSLVSYRVADTPEARGALLGTLAHPVGARLIGHRGPVEWVSYRPDGRMIATASSDATARLWNVSDLARPKAVSELKGHTASVVRAVFSPDGRVLATASVDRTARLWDVSDPARPRALATLKGHTNKVASVAFSPKGGVLATVSYDGTTRLWNIADPARPAQIALLRQKYVLNDVAFSPDGRLLAIAAGDGSTTIWDVLDPARPGGSTVLSAPDGGGTWSVTFDPGGRRLATASTTGTLYLWDVTAARRVGTVQGRGSFVYDVTFSPDGKLLASAATDASVTLWDVSNPAEPRRTTALTGFANTVTAAAFSPDGRTLATSSADSMARLWNVSDPARVSYRAGLTEHTGPVNALSISPDGRILATASGDRTVKLWDVSDPGLARSLSTLSGHTDVVQTVRFSADGHMLVSGSSDQTAKLWDVSRPAAPKPLATIKKHVNVVESGAFSPDGRTLVTTSRDGRTYLWDLTDPRAPKLLSSPGDADNWLNASMFSPDGRMLAIGSGTGAIRLWDVSKPAAPRLLANYPAHTNSVLALTYSRDGRTLASAGSDGTARLWDLTHPERPAQVAVLLGHTGAVSSVAFTADGRRLATGARDGTIRIWNLADRARPATWAVLAGSDWVNGVAFTPDGNVLASASGNGTAQLWSLDVEQARRRVCEVSGMIITRSEWAQYVPGLPYSPPCQAA